MTVPLAAPAAMGVKVTVSRVEAPPASVNGVDTVPIENPAPETETLETVTEPVPVLVMVMFRDAELLTLTLPKLTEVGEADRVPGVVPVPESGIDKCGFDASLVTLIEPVAAPITVGAKVTVNVRFAFGARVNGVVTDASEKPAPEIESALTVRDAPPVFVIVTVRDADV